MKLDPLTLLLDVKFNLNKKFYFVSGNEPSLIQKISEKIIEKHQITDKFFVKNIDSLDGLVDEIGLCEDKYL